jgi:predicted dehydrogenase
LKPETAFGTQANSAVEVGIVGCGGRGVFIGGSFQEFAGARIVALHDAFQDRVGAAAKSLNLAAPRTYTGLEGYRDLAGSKLDAVAVLSPVYYHPEQIRAAVDAGRHVFMAKPLAVDVWGCRHIEESGNRAASKRLSMLVDFQTRVRPAFREAAERVHRGEIGAPVLGHVYYHAGRLQPKNAPGAPEVENRLRNWVFDKALSGDIIVEQNIHVIDVANWYLRGHPVRAAGTGGRKARVDVGDCWDHFLVQYEYPGGVRVDFSSAQFTRGYSDLCIRVYGDAGTVDSHYNGLVRITGGQTWTGAEKDPTFREGAITNVKDFVASIREGKPLNNLAYSLESTLTSILGRMAAYRNSSVSWDEMMRSNEKLEASLRL